MRTRLATAVSAALIGAFVGALALSVVYGTGASIRFEMDRDLPPTVTGFYPPERDGTLTFAWTRSSAEITLPGISRRVPWACSASIRGWRTAGIPLPELRFTADGLDVLRWQVRSALEDVRFDIPTRPDRSGLVLRIDVSDTFRPGPADPRDLGVVFDYLVCAPAEGRVAHLPSPALAQAALGGALLGLGFGLAGLPLFYAAAIVSITALAQAWPLGSGMAPYLAGRPPAWLLAAGLSVIFVLACAGLDARRRGPLARGGRLAGALSVAACYLKLLVLIHPSMPPTDAVFQAHRLDWVLAGRFYFTSVTPDGYDFPYGISLYLVAAPLAWLTRDHVALLRVVVVVAEALAGLLLFAMVSRTWGDRRAALFALLLFHVTPIAQSVIGTANLTNAFGESAALMAVATVVLLPVTAPAWAWIALPAAVASIAFTAHFSTLVVLAATLCLIAVAYLILGVPALHRKSSLILLGLGVAVIVSFVAFYGHFMPTYRSQAQRLAGEVRTMTGGGPAGGTPAAGTLPMAPGGAAPKAGDAGPAPGASRALTKRARPPLDVRFTTMLRRTLRAYGPILPAMALLGLVSLVRRRVRDRMSLAIVGWLLTLVTFSALAVLTPLEMRYHLAVAPAMAILAGLEASDWWRLGGWRRLMAGVAVAAVVLFGARGWFDWLR
jgi:hypothetical protein